VFKLRKISISNFVLSKVSAHFELTMDRVEQIGDTSLIDWKGLKTKKVGKDRKFFGNFTNKVDFDNSYKISVELYVKQGNEYRKTPYRLPTKSYCNFISDDDYYYKEMSEFSDFIYPFECPQKKVR
jgi:hypothetical protein